MAAALVSLLVLAAGWSRPTRHGLLIAGIGLAAGAVLGYVLWQWVGRRRFRGPSSRL